MGVGVHPSITKSSSGTLNQSVPRLSLLLDTKASLIKTAKNSQFILLKIRNKINNNNNKSNRSFENFLFETAQSFKSQNCCFAKEVVYAVFVISSNLLTSSGMKRIPVWGKVLKKYRSDTPSKRVRNTLNWSGTRCYLLRMTVFTLGLEQILFLQPAHHPVQVQTCYISGCGSCGETSLNVFCPVSWLKALAIFQRWIGALEGTLEKATPELSFKRASRESLNLK